jgi:hypothetical protein
MERRRDSDEVRVTLHSTEGRDGAEGGTGTLLSPGHRRIDAVGGAIRVAACGPARLGSARLVRPISSRSNT